jgi:hypothetical protein
MTDTADTLQTRMQEILNLHLDNTEELYDTVTAISTARKQSDYQRADALKDWITELVEEETQTDWTNPVQAMINEIVTKALAFIDWVELVRDHQPDTPQVEDVEEEEVDTEPFADNPRLQTAYAEFIAAVEDDDNAGHTISSMRAVRDANDRLQDIAQEAETE